jgi:hypothetical protein
MEKEKTAATHKERRLYHGKKLGIGVGAVIVVFLLGYLLGYLPSRNQARNSQEEKTRLEQKLILTEEKLSLTEKKLKLVGLHGQLGLVSYEVNRSNYAEAAQRSTEFFNGLQETFNHTRDETLKQQLQAILTRRDEITANLAKPDPAVKEKLAQLYLDFFHLANMQPGAGDKSARR